MIRSPFRHLMFLVLSVVALTGCASDVWQVPITPTPGPLPGPSPTPPAPTPTPPPTPAPTPVPADKVATWVNVLKVVVGMSKADAEAALGVPYAFSSTQDDGAVVSEYPSVDEAGSPEYLQVRYVGGKVAGRSRTPRAVNPAPSGALVGGAPGTVDEGQCGPDDPNCQLNK